MVDTPYVIMGICCLWRAPLLLYRALTEADTARERRSMVKGQLFNMIKDIPCLLLLIPMVVTVWRLFSLKRRFDKV